MIIIGDGLTFEAIRKRLTYIKLLVTVSKPVMLLLI